MPGLLDLLQPTVTPIGGLLAPATPAPVVPQQVAPALPPQTPARGPGFFGRIGNALFPAPTALGGLLSPDDTASARKQALLSIGLSLLANSAPQNGQNAPPTLAAIGQALQAGREGFQGTLGQILQQRQFAAQAQQQSALAQAQAERQAKLDALGQQYAPQPNETPEQMRARLTGYISDAIRIDPSLAGKFNTFSELFKAPTEAQPARGVQTTLLGKDGKPHVVLVNPTDGRTIADLGIAPKQPGAPKPPTQQQAQAGAYAVRMVNDERSVRDLEDRGVALPDKALLFAPTSAKGMAAYATLSPEQQELYSLASDWVAAKLRKESGATISDSEWASEMRRYFRALGDKSEVAATKRKLRGVANYGLIEQAGPTYSLAPEDSALVDNGRAKPSVRKAMKSAGDLYSKYGLTPPGH